MLKGVEYGKSQKAFRRKIQRSNLSADSIGHGVARGLPGASARPSNGGAMAGDIRKRCGLGASECEGEIASTGDREAAHEDRPDGSADRPFKKTSRDFTIEEKRRWVSDNWEKFGSLSKACKAIEISTSSYYYKVKVDPVVRAERDADLRSQIEEIQSRFPQYGVRQVYWELFWGYGKRVNRKRIHRVMKEHGLRAQIYRGFKISTTDSNHSNRIYPNLLHGIEVKQPNAVWVTDITYVRIQTGFVYLAAILDLFSRRVIGWAVSKKIDTELCLEAMRMAVEDRNPGKGCIHHSDRGVQYTSNDYVEFLNQKGFKISMSRKGNCWDNAHMESFFGMLKREEVHLHEYETFTDVIMRLPQFIEDIYNKKRRHGSLGGLTPVEFENMWEAGQLQNLGISYVTKLWDGSSN
jgi:transposase InsO family protein